MIKLKWATVGQRKEIQTYLFENMGKISFKRWGNILDCRWNNFDDNYGIVVEEDGALAGFLGIVFADRIIAGRDHRIGNITSWFLEKHLRRGGLGQEMLAKICEKPDITYTATSANFRSGALLKKIGWDLLEDTRLFWNRREKPGSNSNSVEFYSGFEQVSPLLNQAALQIVDDHVGLNVTPHLLRGADSAELFFVTYAKRKGEHDTTHHEILHASDKNLLSHYVAEVSEFLLHEPNSILSSDKRFLASSVAADESQALEVSRYFKPCNKMDAENIDFLYGEVVLLDLKIY